MRQLILAAACLLPASAVFAAPRWAPWKTTAGPACHRHVLRVRPRYAGDHLVGHARQTKSTSDFYTAGGGITRFQGKPGDCR